MTPLDSNEVRVMEAETVINSKTYLSREHPFAYATCVNFCEGKGLLQIHSDWGTYSAFWGSMGDQSIERFILSCGSSYIEQNLARSMNYMGVKKEALHKLSKFMAHCWPNLKAIIAKELP